MAASSDNGESKEGKESREKWEYRVIKVNDEGRDLAPNSEWGSINKLAEDGWEYHEVLGWNVNSGWGHMLFRKPLRNEEDSPKTRKKS